MRCKDRRGGGGCTGCVKSSGIENDETIYDVEIEGTDLCRPDP